MIQRYWPTLREATIVGACGSVAFVAVAAGLVYTNLLIARYRGDF